MTPKGWDVIFQGRTLATRTPDGWTARPPEYVVIPPGYEIRTRLMVAPDSEIPVADYVVYATPGLRGWWRRWWYTFKIRRGWV